MPYDKLTDLPEPVQALPKHAQEIYLASFNSAVEQYDGNEAKSHATAWTAVKTKYEKDADGKWQAKPEDLSKSAPFTVELPLQKAWVGTDGGLHWRCQASSGAVDAQGQSMTKAALESMAAAEGVLVFGTSHRERDENALGKATSLGLEGDKLVAEGVFFDWVPQAVTMHHLMQTGARQFAVSVGGGCTTTSPRWDATLGKARSDIIGARLEHLFFCKPGEARNPDTFVEALAKAAALASEVTPQEALEMSSTSYAENVAEEAGEQEAEYVSYATEDMLCPLNKTLGQIMAQDVPDPEKRALVEQVMQEFADDLLKRLWVDQPEVPLAMAEAAPEEGAEDMPDDDKPADAPEEEPMTPAEGAKETVSEEAPAPEAEAVVVPQEEVPVVEPEAVPEVPQEVPAEAVDAEPPADAALTAPEAEAPAPAEDAEEETEEEAPAEEGLAKAQTLVADLEDQLAKAQAEIEKLAAMPVAGGPRSTVQADETERMDKAVDAAHPFSEVAAVARAQVGTPEGEAARRTAHGLFIDALVLTQKRSTTNPAPPA